MTAITRTEPEFKTRFLIGKHAQRMNGPANCAVYLVVELHNRNGKGTELSIMGEVWNPLKTDVLCGGQMQDVLRDYLTTTLISEEKLSRILELWDRWHLNGLNAGCEHQRAAATHDAWTGHGAPGWVWPVCQCCGYRYGSRWLHEELPPAIVAEIKSWGTGQDAS